MFCVILGFVFIFIMSMLTGVLFSGVFSKVTGTKKSLPSIASLVITGLTVITVYTGFFSIVYKIGLVCHLIALIAVIICLFAGKDDLKTYLSSLTKTIFSWEGFLYLCIILLIAFYTSRGQFHTDTNIYHAGNIRIYEETGLIKGMGNLQLHYGYNSAYLALCSFFSMHFILKTPLHAVTGFLFAFITIYSLWGFKDFFERKTHITDGIRIGALLYVLTNLTGAMSPATDYGTMVFSFYLILRFAEVTEDEKTKDDPYVTGLVSLLAVFAVTLKLSSTALCLLVIYPLVLIIKKKNYRLLIGFSALSLLIVLPYFIRNVLISGYLIYPFGAIDIFNPVWKVPMDYLKHDSDQIKVWARCLFDTTKADLPIREWLPIWWDGQSDYAQSLLYANIAGTVLMFANLVIKLIYKLPIKLTRIIIYASCFASAAVWFFIAPFVRYGLAFLLAIPLMSAFTFLEYDKKGFFGIVSGVLTILTLICFCRYIANYASDDLVFIKHNLKEPYYIVQKDYDRINADTTVINSVTFYHPPIEEINSYYNYPGTCYSDMLERSTLIGDDLKSGLRPK